MPVGGGGTNQRVTPNQQAWLASNTQPLSPDHLTRLSQNTQFSTNWRQLAHGLGLSEAESEECQVRGRDDPAEVCYQVLRVWRDNLGPSQATVSQLVTGIQQTRLLSMLDVLYIVCKS